LTKVAHDSPNKKTVSPSKQEKKEYEHKVTPAKIEPRKLINLFEKNDNEFLRKEFQEEMRRKWPT
jgi:hypothetical protein